ncbi:hypothetical protein RAS1_01590 [Phycisphaerae bacterium RAS1]|nr:hypothetical protein RAS1_01590 [Phycisphaerae bacterium RAS1]
MRGATDCAKRVKQVFASLRSKLGKPTRPAHTDPVTQLILGVFSRDVPEAKAREALEAMRGLVVDYNELRVIPALELAQTLGEGYPDVRLKCEDMSRALNRIFAVEHTVSLDHLAEMSRKESVAYLERVPGLEAYTRARIRLLGLNQHAIPLDEAMLAVAKRDRMIDAKAALDEAEAFLERQIDEADGVEFFALLRKHAWSEMATAVRKRQVDRIQSVPPTRATSNMLQAIAAGVHIEVDDIPVNEFESLGEPGAEGAGVEPAAAAARGDKKSSGKPPDKGNRKAGAPAREAGSGRRAEKPRKSAGGAANARTGKGAGKSAARSRSA